MQKKVEREGVGVKVKLLVNDKVVYWQVTVPLASVHVFQQGRAHVAMDLVILIWHI